MVIGVLSGIEEDVVVVVVEEAEGKNLLNSTLVCI